MLIESFEQWEGREVHLKSEQKLFFAADGIFGRATLLPNHNAARQR